ncbi:MAG TPA: ATP-binding protein [Planctomycetota bacterium]|nr:ATP-binding protein [Planctomycetota bacterium]
MPVRLPRPAERRQASRLKWILLGRLAVAIVGLGATLAGRFDDRYALAQYAVLLAAVFLNLVYLLMARAGVRPSRLAALQLSVDVGLVGALVYLTGIDRVYALLYFGIIIAAALALDLRWALGLASAASVVLAVVSTLYYLGGLSELALALPGVDPDLTSTYASRLPFLLPFLALFGVLLHVVALLAGRLAAEISRVRILNDEILQNMAGGVLAADRLGSVQFINAQAQRLLGLRDGDASRGRRMEDVLPRRVAELLHRALRGEDRVADEIQLEGTLLRVAVSPLHDADAGALRGVVALVNDLSLRTRMEEMTRRAERFQALLEMSAAMAHEIRNPLASIRGAAQELQSGELSPEEDRKLLQVVMRESDRLNQIISEFLEYASDRPLDLDLFDLAELLRETVLLLEARGQHNVEIRQELPRSMLCRGESAKLKQVFLNLGLNALDACGQAVRIGHVTVRCAAGRALDGSRREGILVEFVDDGCGIPRENVARVFDPFFTTKPNGTGMGLAIARKIVRGHGGEIVVESEEGKGTAVRVWLPS